MLDLWVSAIYNDNQVQGSDLGPVVYFRNGTGNPLVTYTESATAPEIPLSPTPSWLPAGGCPGRQSAVS